MGSVPAETAIRCPQRLHARVSQDTCHRVMPLKQSRPTQRRLLTSVPSAHTFLHPERVYTEPGLEKHHARACSGSPIVPLAPASIYVPHVT